MLIHWEARRAPRAGDEADRRAGQRRAAADPGRPRRRVATSAGRSCPTSRRASNSGELWVSIDPAADHDARSPRSSDTVAGYPGLDRTRHHLHERPDRPRSSGDADRTSSSASTARTSTSSQARPTRSAQAIAGVDGLAAPTVADPIEEPTVKIEVDLEAAASAGLKPGDVRRAAATLLSGHRGRHPVRGAEDLRGRGLGRARVRNEHLQRSSDLLIDRPTRRPRPPRRRRRRRDRARPVASSDARACSASSTSSPTSRGRDVGAVDRRRQQRARGGRLPARIPRRGPRRRADAPGDPVPPDRDRGRRRDRRSSCSSRRPSAAGGWRSLVFLALPAALGRGARRRRC